MKKILIMITAMAALTACGSKEAKSQEATANKVEAGVLVKSATAELQKVALNETYTSEIKAYKENDITPAVAGLHISEIKVDVGDRVTKGQVLVVMDQTTLKQQEINLATTQDSYDRMKPVHEAGGVSDQQIIQLENQLNLQKEVVENLRKNSTLLSPITGIITARNFEAGDLFAQMPILHVMQINQLKVMANISEQYYTQVKVGQEVNIEVDIFPGETFTGKVSRINPALDATTRTFGVEVTIPNAKERLRPGMYARTTFHLGDRESVLIPDMALQKQVGSSERYVYVIKNGVAEYRLVKDGRRVGDKIEILEGLSAGEVVATTSFTRLMSGKKVEIKNE
ncbi:MAG: efflux RND transporter periplasmic adaptor subunit [Alistipes sp.]|nr:efflux RND transporter periplasmic adaptor subunit [Alistipes sp.]MBO7306433.1 efflux RND transporter periplasmic adaptor subunit [Alistipes sp.]